jgi:hypothetical protein
MIQDNRKQLPRYKNNGEQKRKISFNQRELLDSKDSMHLIPVLRNWLMNFQTCSTAIQNKHMRNWGSLVIVRNQEKI